MRQILRTMSQIPGVIPWRQNNQKTSMSRVHSRRGRSLSCIFQYITLNSIAYNSQFIHIWRHKTKLTIWLSVRQGKVKWNKLSQRTAFMSQCSLDSWPQSICSSRQREHWWIHTSLNRTSIDMHWRLRVLPHMIAVLNVLILCCRRATTSWLTSSILKSIPIVEVSQFLEAVEADNSSTHRIWDILCVLILALWSIGINHRQDHEA